MAKITVDTREQDNVEKMLRNLGIEYSKETMATGDYRVEDDEGNTVIMERKTVPDFIGSLMSGRLEQQMRRLSDEKCPMLLITGSFSEYKKFAKFSKFTVDQLHGAIASCIVKYGLRSVIWIQSASDRPHSNGIGIGCKIISKVAEGKLDKIPPRRIKRRRGNSDQIEIIHILFGVPVNVAENMLEKFGTIRNILDCNDGDLREVKGMGPSRVKNMRRILGDL